MSPIDSVQTLDDHYPTMTLRGQLETEIIFTNLVSLAAMENQLGKLNLSRDGSMVKFVDSLLRLPEADMIQLAIVTDNELLRIVLTDFLVLDPLERIALFAHLIDLATMLDQVSHSVNHLLIAVSHDDTIADIYALFGAPVGSDYRAHVAASLGLIELASNWQGFWKALEARIKIIPFTLAQLLRGINANLSQDYHQVNFKLVLKLIYTKLESSNHALGQVQSSKLLVAV
ncbi:MAG: hypothetical protein QM523_04305 [Candidatus Pacebacteria bacterium]|nr:hypothetical protein [Candidatus Paceibacterota bacterium]